MSKIQSVEKAKSYHSTRNEEQSSMDNNEIAFFNVNDDQIFSEVNDTNHIIQHTVAYFERYAKRNVKDYQRYSQGIIRKQHSGQIAQAIGIAGGVTGALSTCILLASGNKAGQRLAHQIISNPNMAQKLGLYVMGPYIGITAMTPMAIFMAGVCKTKAISLVKCKPNSKKGIIQNNNRDYILKQVYNLVKYIISFPPAATESFLTMFYCWKYISYGAIPLAIIDFTASTELYCFALDRFNTLVIDPIMSSKPLRNLRYKFLGIDEYKIKSWVLSKDLIRSKQLLINIPVDKVQNLYKELFFNDDKLKPHPDISRIFKLNVDEDNITIQQSKLYSTGKVILSVITTIVSVIGSWYFYCAGQSSVRTFNQKIHIDMGVMESILGHIFGVIIFCLRGILQVEGCNDVVQGVYDTIVKAPRQVINLLKTLTNTDNNETHISFDFSQFRNAIEVVISGWFSLSYIAVVNQMTEDFTNTGDLFGLLAMIFACTTTLFTRAAFMKRFIQEIICHKKSEQSELIVILTIIDELMSVLKDGVQNDVIEYYYNQVHGRSNPYELWFDSKAYENERKNILPAQKNINRQNYTEI